MDNIHKAAKLVHEKAIFYRGSFLNRVAVIERDIAMLLTDYFCVDDEDKKELFYKYVVTAPFFSLSNKKDILKNIVKKDYPSYWEESSKILKDLDEIITFRNRLAHSVLDVSEEALNRSIEDGIGLIDWKNAEPITDEDFEDWEVRANSVSSCLSTLRLLLPFKERKHDNVI